VESQHEKYSSFVLKYQDILWRGVSNGLAFSCHERAADHLQKTNDLAREVVG
jgi:hypothetical protein